MGNNISTHQNCRLHLIYDGPIFEEYYFFNGYHSFFKRKSENRLKASFNRASNIVVYSDPMKKHCIENIDPDNSKYKIHQNIDFSRFKFITKEKPTDCLNICFIGSFLKWHNVDFLINAFDEISKNKSGLPLKLFLIGDGMEKKRMETLVEELENPDIIFTGYLDGDELTRLQEKMHIGIMPGSNWYGAPNKIFEYGAMGMACIAPSTPTIEYIFKDSEVSFFELNNFASFKLKLNQLVTNQNLILELSKRLNQFTKENYSSEKTKIFYINFLN